MTQVLIDRELLERAVKADASIGASSIALVDGWKAMAQIRAILAQPAQPEVEGRKPDCFVIGRTEKIGIVDSPLPVGTKLYTAPITQTEQQPILMPERKQKGWQCEQGIYPADGWNAALDEVARLNAAPIAQTAQPEVQRLREALDHIGGLSRALRVGGPDPMDLEELSNTLEEAVDTAHAALAETNRT